MEIADVLIRLRSLLESWGITSSDWILTGQYANLLQGYGVEVRKGHLNVLVPKAKIPWETDPLALEFYPPINSNYGMQYQEFVDSTGFGFDLLPHSEEAFKKQQSRTVQHRLPNGANIALLTPRGELVVLSDILSKSDEKGWGVEKGRRIWRYVGELRDVIQAKGEPVDSFEEIIAKYDRFGNIVDTLNQYSWVQNWATTNMGLPFPSLYGRMYAKELPKYSGLGFTRNLVMCENGVSSNFIPADELNKICTAHAKQVAQNTALAQQWCDELYKRTDNALALFEKLKKKDKYTVADYRSVEEVIYAHVPANFTLKRVIDFLPPDIIEKYLETFSKVREYTEEVYPEADRMFRKIATQLFPELSEKEVFVLATTDIDAFEKQDIRPNKESLKKRVDGVAIIFDENGKGEFITGEQFQALQKLLTQGNNTSVLKGLPAFKGVVRGSVRVVFDPSSTDFIDGEILVTGMTRPDFLPLMKKAAAFVTDSGGLLSHAAITARELKKPCIVGTNVATKILKDGDIVEVDAEKGIVRKL